MRRKDREVSNINDIIDIIGRCEVCRLAFFDEEYPYIVPLNFGHSYDGTTLEFYFHGANAGKKLELLNENNKVGFELDCSLKLIANEDACEYSMEYESVCGNGTVILLDESEKAFALQQLMKQYVKDKEFQFNEKVLNSVAVFKLVVNSISGKRLKK